MESCVLGCIPVIRCKNELAPSGRQSASSVMATALRAPVLCALFTTLTELRHRMNTAMERPEGCAALRIPPPNNLVFQVQPHSHNRAGTESSQGFSLVVVFVLDVCGLLTAV